MQTEAILNLGFPNPEFVQFLAENPSPPPPPLTIEAYRELTCENRDASLERLGSCPQGLVETDLQIPMRDGTKILARSCRPEIPPDRGSPLVVLYHGGGFCLGDYTEETGTCRSLTRRLGVVTLSVDYRLAPENPFPTPVNDAYDALEWAASHTVLLHANPERGFIIGGVSAGGNITAVLAHLARDKGLSPPLTGQYLSVPGVCSAEVLPEKYRDVYLSLHQNDKSPFLGHGVLDWFIANYNPDVKSPLYSTLNDPKEHAGLPPAYFQVCGLDPLRDDGLIYERVLREDYGIKTRLGLYPGLPHAFWVFFPALKASVQWIDETVQGINWLLEAKE